YRSYTFFLLSSPCDHRDLHSFPTRRSSDLHDLIEIGIDGDSDVDVCSGPAPRAVAHAPDLTVRHVPHDAVGVAESRGTEADALEDRKSTRLNSSHDQISYAVFCLKKKKKK